VTPRALTIWAFAVGIALFIAGVWMHELILVGLGVNVALLLVLAIDALVTLRPSRIQVEREAPTVLSVGTVNPVILRVLNEGRRPIEVEIHDESPEPAEVEGLPIVMRLDPEKPSAYRYRLTPQQRGQNGFGAIHLRYVSRFGFWTLVDRREADLAVRIFPDFREAARLELLATWNRLEEAGLKLWKLRGQGGEFERLREYRREDEMRFVDWRATAKHQRLISREFTVERNQSVVGLLACGRSMANEVDGLSHLDLGLNAAITLSYVALGQGDNVSVLAFSNELERFIGPLRGRASIRSIIRETYDLSPSESVSDYRVAAERIERRHRKRALVILVTHTLDDEHLEEIGRALVRRRSSHVFLCVLLRDEGLTRLAEKVPESAVEAFHVGAASELIGAQERKIEELRERGALVLEVFPSDLNTDLINQYLELKSRHLL